MKRYIIAAAIVLSGTALAAIAAEQLQQTPTPTLSQLRKLRESIPGKKPLAPVNSATTLNGWNFKVCAENLTFTSAVFVVNTDQSQFVVGSNDLQTTLKAQLVAACEHAPSGYWIHVTDATRASFDAVAIDYP
jgi:hypothetical protein